MAFRILPVLAACALFALAVSALAAGDAVHGKAVFEQSCAICHTTEKGGGSGVGPDLFGVVGRKAATAPNFFYSPALKKAGFAWTDAKLVKWVQGPAKMVPGTRMIFAGLKSPKDAADVVAYLKSLK